MINSSFNKDENPALEAKGFAVGTSGPANPNHSTDNDALHFEAYNSTLTSEQAVETRLFYSRDDITEGVIEFDELYHSNEGWYQNFSTHFDPDWTE